MSFLNKYYEESLKMADSPVNLQTAALYALSLIDLTSLSEDDTEGKIAALCRRAVTKRGPVAAVCVYPQFVAFAKKQLAGSTVKIATVANFPEGTTPLKKVIKEVEQAIVNGADEVDVVWPYQTYLSGKIDSVGNMVRACSLACGHQVHLKVILETGAFPDTETIYSASRLIIDAGADFLKTSTGKIEIGATLEAATAMLLAIKESEQSVGFKAAGGIRTTQQAGEYLNIAKHVMGQGWISQNTFRFGASSLLDDILKTLGE